MNCAGMLVHEGHVEWVCNDCKLTGDVQLSEMHKRETNPAFGVHYHVHLLAWREHRAKSPACGNDLGDVFVHYCDGRQPNFITMGKVL